MPALPSHFCTFPSSRMRGTHAVYASLWLIRSHLATARSACFHVALGSLVAAATHWLKIQHSKFIIKHRGLRPPLVAEETLLVSA
jgi:hypothetical protein